jgi:hypothetical protein
VSEEPQFEPTTKELVRRIASKLVDGMPSFSVRMNRNEAWAFIDEQEKVHQAKPEPGDDAKMVLEQLRHVSDSLADDVLVTFEPDTLEIIGDRLGCVTVGQIRALIRE